VKLAEFLTAVEGDLLLLEKAISIGTTARVAARLIAVRMPEAIVNARRRIARKNAKKKGYTPSQAHLTVDGLEPLYYQCTAHHMERRQPS